MCYTGTPTSRTVAGPRGCAPKIVCGQPEVATRLAAGHVVASRVLVAEPLYVGEYHSLLRSVCQTDPVASLTCECWAYIRGMHC